MKKLNIYQTTQEEDLQSQDSTLEPNSSKFLKLSTENIYMVRENFYQFIEEIGALKYETVDLSLYKSDFTESKPETQINLDGIKSLFQNTIRKMTANKRQKKNWSKDDFIIMLWVIEKYNTFKNKCIQQYTQSDWKQIAFLVPGKDYLQCMFKWLGLKINKQTEKFPWTQTQENLLKKLVNQSNPNHWFDVSKQLYLQNSGFKVYRSAKQCRERWACYLNPKLKKGPWSPQEDMILLGKYLQYGKKWSNIAKLLNGRTQNAVKNRFNLILDKKQKIRVKVSDVDFIRNYLKSLELNLLMKPSEINVNKYGNSFKIQFEQNDLIVDQHSQTQNEDSSSNELFCLTNRTDQNDIDNLSDTAQEQKNTQFIKFKNLNLKDLISLEENIFPAQYDEEYFEINYIEMKPMQNIKQKIKFIQNYIRQEDLSLIESHYFEDNPLDFAYEYIQDHELDIINL